MTTAAAQDDANRPARRPGAGWLRAVLLAALVTGLPLAARAQNPSPPRILVADTIALPASSQAPLRITIAPMASLPRNAFVRVRGLPPMAALSEGHTIAPGAWAVALSSLPELRITVPNTSQSRNAVTVTLVSVDGAVLAEAQTTLVIGAAQPPGNAPSNATILRAAPSTEIAAVPPEPKAAPPPSLKAEDRDRGMRLVKRGQQFVEDSNISEARLLFEKAADLGLAEGAMALAATYDEAELTRQGVRGVQADAKEARRWYERAAQLGAKEAQQRLQRLGAK